MKAIQLVNQTNQVLTAFIGASCVHDFNKIKKNEQILD